MTFERLEQLKNTAEQLRVIADDRISAEAMPGVALLAIVADAAGALPDLVAEVERLAQERHECHLLLRRLVASNRPVAGGLQAEARAMLDRHGEGG